MEARNAKLSAMYRRCVLVVATVGIAAAAPTAAYAKQVRVMVDPGHGGKDPGAVSAGLVEKESNLQISELVVKAARRQGWKVGMTRSTDKFIDLNNRPAKATRFKADVLVSVHSNSTGKASKGFMTIYRSGSGKRLGRNIMRELDPLTRYEDIGNRRDSRGLAVLRGAKQPAVIVELMAVTSPRERRELKSHQSQKQMAEAIVRGIARNEGVKYKEPVSAKAKAKKAAEKKAKADAKRKAAELKKSESGVIETQAPADTETKQSEAQTAGKKPTAPVAEPKIADNSAPEIRDGVNAKAPVVDRAPVGTSPARVLFDTIARLLSN